MGASRSRGPFSASWRAAGGGVGLQAGARGEEPAGEAGDPVSAVGTAARHAPPPLTRAAERPGIPKRAMAARIAASSAPARAGGSADRPEVTCGGDAPGEGGGVAAGDTAGDAGGEGEADGTGLAAVPGPA